MNSLKAESYLGSPQQLTRSCSCKRPGSFKKMKAKNSGVSPSISPNRRDLNSASQNSPTANTPIVVTTPAAFASGRRGTHCSITISEDLEAVMQQNRAGSLPFENLAQQQQQANNSYLNPNEDAEVYRVRQFNITNKGSVINRGDSFKRSFKRSNNSISSKKDNSPNNLNSESNNNNHNNNTLNLPDYLDSKSGNSSNIGLNEISEKDVNNSGANLLSSGSTNLSNANNNGSCATFNSMNTNLTTNNSTPIGNLTQQESSQTFVVYILGSSSVGKNALIKQFKTSEYRGTYEINANQSADEDADEGVCVMLDGVESRLQFVSMDIDAATVKPGCASLFDLTKDNNAFVLVYSISDKSSFQIACELLKMVRNSENKSQPVILVGNKSDLVRKRSVNREDGRNMALKYGCKFVETSVAINDKVDDLLAGVLKQIRINEGVDKDLARISKPNCQSNTLNANATSKTSPETATTTFIENKPPKNLQVHNNSKKHSRNFSDAQLQDLINKSTNTSSNILSFKSNTLTRRLFRSKNKENNQAEINAKHTNPSYSAPSSNKNSNNGSIMHGSGNLAGGNNNSGGSFFHKLFNTLFKKKTNMSHLQSVENLFTPPTQPSISAVNKLKK